MRGKIVLVPFPFDDLSSKKVRPAVCLTDEIAPYRHLVLAFITSKLSPTVSATDLELNAADADFATTGLKVPSTIRLHRLLTVSRVMVQRELGQLSVRQQRAVDEALRRLFRL